MTRRLSDRTSADLAASTIDIADVVRDHLDDVTRFGATADAALLVLPTT